MRKLNRAMCLVKREREENMKDGGSLNTFYTHTERYWQEDGCAQWSGNPEI
jgi:hypothetical protein